MEIKRYHINEWGYCDYDIEESEDGEIVYYNDIESYIKDLIDSNMKDRLKRDRNFSDVRINLLEKQKAAALKMLKDLSESTTATYMEIDEVINILQDDKYEIK